MYIDEHGEREPPTAEEWEMIIALARESVTQTRSQTGETQTGILLMYTPSPHTTVLGGTLMYTGSLKLYRWNTSRTRFILSMLKHTR